MRWGIAARRAGICGMQKCWSLGSFVLFPPSPKNSAKSKGTCTHGGQHLLKRSFPGWQHPREHRRGAGTPSPQLAVPFCRLIVFRVAGGGEPDNQICRG